MVPAGTSLVLIEVVPCLYEGFAMLASSVSPSPRPVPRRHGINPEQARRVAQPVLGFIRDKQAAQPSPERWQRLGEALNEGDVPADDLVEWMHAFGMGPARGMFEMALAKGIDAVPDAPAPLRAFFEQAEREPAWLDRARLERGVKASHLSGLTGMRVLRDLGLMAGYQAGAINQTLVMTGALEKGAARRIAETTKWWMDCMTPGGLTRFGIGFTTTLRVRLIHAMVRRQLAAKPAWDAQALGLPINQVDMQATYLGFSVTFLLGQRVMGCVLRQEEAEDVMHLWRYVGWLMGVREEWLCESEQAGRVALYQNLLSQAPADGTSQQLARALADEPLYRHYPRFKALRAPWEKAVHLSICRLFLGRQGMDDLGLPGHVTPWYPLAFAPVNFVWSALHRLVPGGLDRMAIQGRRTQEAQLAIMFGAARPDIRPIGGAAAHSHTP